MTKIITFNFTNPSRATPQTTGVSLNQREITSPEAQRTIEEMNSLMVRLIARLKEKNEEKIQDSYKKITNCTQFTASIELPPEGEKCNLIMKDVANTWCITLLLAHETAAALNLRSLVQLHSTPPRLSPTLVQAISTPAPTVVIAAAVPKYKKVEPKKVVKTSPTPTPPQGLISRFFAWILSFFPSSQTPPAITEKSPLIYPTLPTPVVEGIRPLRNGNNICFINAIFQALMNVPEMKAALIAAHEKKIVREAKRLEELAGLIAAAEKELGITQRELQEVTKDYSWYHYLLPDAKYTAVYNKGQRQFSALLALQNEQKKVQDSMQASRTFKDAIANYGEKSTYLNDLRGFIEGSLGSWKQEDACELLDMTFEPLIHLFEHPEETTPAILASVKRIMFEFGEEKRLQEYQPKADEAEKLATDLASITDPSSLPGNRTLASLANSCIVRLDIPSEKTQLQGLLKAQLTMQKLSQQDDLTVFKNNGQPGWYQVTEKQLVIKTSGAPPDFVTLQLKRFRVNSDRTISKIHTEIELPQDNKVTLKVDGKDVDYEIQTLVQHSGDTPSGGHYFSYVRKGEAWVEANDTTVEKLDQLPSSAPSQVYVIFLKKV